VRQRLDLPGLQAKAMGALCCHSEKRCRNAEYESESKSRKPKRVRDDCGEVYSAYTSSALESLAHAADLLMVDAGARLTTINTGTFIR